MLTPNHADTERDIHSSHNDEFNALSCARMGRKNAF